MESMATYHEPRGATRLAVAAACAAATFACGQSSTPSSAAPIFDGGASMDGTAVGDAGTADATTPTDGATDAASTGCPAPAASVEPAEQLFIAPSGVDTAAGTEAAPLASLHEAAIRFPAGGTVVVAAGTYGAQTLAATGTVGHPLLIRAAEGAMPIFDGSSVTSNYGAVIHLTTARHVAFEGLEIRNGTGPNVTGIGADGAVSDLTIRNCSIHDMNGTMSRFAGDTIVIEQNELYNGALVNLNHPSQFQNGGWPTCMGTEPDTANPSSPWPTNVVIRANHIHDCWGEGIGIWYGAGVIVEDNVVERAFNVGIYMDNASNVQVARNFVEMATGMAGDGGVGTGILMGVEPYTSLGLAYVPDHDITIIDNVVVARGIGWWTSSNTSPSNSYANVTISENTIVSATGAGVGFAAVASGATPPTGCTVVDNVVSEADKTYVGDTAAFMFGGNAWLDETKPSVAGTTDVSETVSVPTIAAATDAEALAAEVGTGIASGVPTDFVCAARSAAAPTRGAFEH
jgi:hypothetical protein